MQTFLAYLFLRAKRFGEGRLAFLAERSRVYALHRHNQTAERICCEAEASAIEFCYRLEDRSLILVVRDSANSFQIAAGRTLTSLCISRLSTYWTDQHSVSHVDSYASLWQN
ncbi:hypothetical protein SH501x_001915 [Pirellulaceae bacterium SH501]